MAPRCATAWREGWCRVAACCTVVECLTSPHGPTTPAELILSNAPLSQIKKLEEEIGRLQRELDRPQEEGAARQLANKLQSQVG